MKIDEAISLLANATYSHAWQGNQKLTQARQMAIDALEKQRPIKPGPKELDIAGVPCIPCGNCGTSINTMWDYCPWCGQRIES